MLRWYARRRAAKVDARRAAMLDGFLARREVILENTPAQMIGAVDPRESGFVFVTSQRLIWHFPNALANNTGGMPLHAINELAYADGLLAVKTNAGGTVGFHLHPGPISAALVEMLAAEAEKAAAQASREVDRRFVRPADPLAVLESDDCA